MNRIYRMNEVRPCSGVSFPNPVYPVHPANSLPKMQTDRMNRIYRMKQGRPSSGMSFLNPVNPVNPVNSLPKMQTDRMTGFTDKAGTALFWCVFSESCESC
jgi:hypothetical protein